MTVIGAVSEGRGLAARGEHEPTCWKSRGREDKRGRHQHESVTVEPGTEGTDGVRASEHHGPEHSARASSPAARATERHSRGALKSEHM